MAQKGNARDYMVQGDITKDGRTVLANVRVHIHATVERVQIETFGARDSLEGHTSWSGSFRASAHADLLGDYQLVLPDARAANITLIAS